MGLILQQTGLKARSGTRSQCYITVSSTKMFYSLHGVLYRRSADVSGCVCVPQGTVVLAAESGEEQVQWMEMLQESGKV